MTTRSCSALLALRMRESMSATGAVSSGLPARFRHAGDAALVCELAEADPAEAELAEDRAGTSAEVAAGIVTDLEPFRARLLDDQRLLCHALLLPSSVLARERHSQRGEKCARLLVVLGGGGDGDVEAADRGNRVVVDFRKDDLLADPEREVAAAVERAEVQSPEVADPRQRDRDQPVEELPHARAAERHARADRHALAQLEARDRLAGAAHLRALAGDRRQ